ncbi:MAG: discoidin domain-containing protein [Phycisphaerales bacterium]|nr:MAG: discoidin domain-containing protein [Phycisphaerales bacterium]
MFRDLVLVVFLSVACSLLTSMPAAYGADGYALEVGGGRTVTIDDDEDALRLGSYAYEFWLKDLEGPTGSWRNIFTKGSTNSSYGRGPLLALRPNDPGLHFDHSTGSGQSTLNTFEGIPVNEWIHVAIVLTSLTGEQIIYQDGEEVARRSSSVTDTTQASVLTIGIGANIVLDDFRVWNYARTPEEIKADMYQELTGDEQGLVGYWKFNEGSGTTAHDVSPYKNDGILAGALWRADAAPVALGPPPAFATNPRPASEATDVSVDVVLNWTPGGFAPALGGHIVFLSESFSDVNDGIGGTTQDANGYDPGRLAFSTTYYWRVDEVNAPPDSTVFRGDIWSFTTEPVGYPVDGATIIATASSAAPGDFGPEKTIDGSGLDADDLHSTGATDMWLSDNEPQGVWVQYEFDKMQKLHQMWVWNANQTFEGLFGFGMKTVTVEYSANGVDWTALADVPEFAKAPGTSGYAHNTTVDFGGAVARYVKLTASSNWGGVLPQFGLSEVRFFSIPVVAREPSLGPGTSDVNPAVTLTWRAGREVATHDVYLSTDEQAVIDGTVPTVSITDASYSSDLDLANTYYWRIDEVNDVEMPTIWQGDVWSFSTSEYLVVEDFESYNDVDPPDPKSHRVFESWIDGYDVPTNGALVGNDLPPYLDRTIVHGGVQSMPVFYSNTGGVVSSEITRTFAAAQNWTKHGVTTLAIWFRGAAGNTGQMYVKINGSKIPYNGAAGNIAMAAWQLWTIDLAAVGTNPESISSLAIGIDGNGAAGTLNFDDIVLYAVAPAPPNEWSIVNDDDDVEEDVGPGSIDMGSSDIELPYEEVGQTNPQIAGLRFADIPIPRGATVTEAWVRFQVDETKGGTEPVNLIIEGELSPNAAAFSSTAGDISSRPTTAAQVQWTVPNWTTVGDQGPDQTTPSIVSIIQEIINQDGWAGGGAIVLMFRDNPANPSLGVRCAEAGPGDDAALLHISYE